MNALNMTAIHKINTEKIFSAIFEKNKDLVVFYKIAQKWENLVKKAFVTSTYPLKLMKDKTLFVAVPNSSVGSQLYYCKEDMVLKINLYFGYNVVADIKTILKPSDKWMKYNATSNKNLKIFFK